MNAVLAEEVILLMKSPSGTVAHAVKKSAPRIATDFIGWLDRLPIVSYGYDTPAFLPYNSQRQVITVATLVAHLVFVAPADERRLVRKIAKRTGNWIRRSVVDNSEDCAYREPTMANTGKIK